LLLARSGRFGRRRTRRHPLLGGGGPAAGEARELLVRLTRRRELLVGFHHLLRVVLHVMLFLVAFRHRRTADHEHPNKDELYDAHRYLLVPRLCASLGSASISACADTKRDDRRAPVGPSGMVWPRRANGKG